ncbi:hypothetical protein ElyMa_003203000 [Elysia marginata]|uniref:Uncharacterized protein n=1 Tax=Elysia marginata TaxID=1093978 RepID=A0AAV4IZY2_9GAST|nr:hypothetical protein ElyMa_003203000 [Elysia marginata]
MLEKISTVAENSKRRGLNIYTGNSKILIIKSAVLEYEALNEVEGFTYLGKEAETNADVSPVRHGKGSFQTVQSSQLTRDTLLGVLNLTVSLSKPRELPL